MAFKLLNPFSIFVSACLTFFLFANQSSCSILDDELFVKSYGFSPALGTWYGDPTGAGSGGACGWADDVKLAPFSAMIAAGNSRIFMGGKGCGDCYEIKCTKEPYCSGKPIRVTITDECPGACNNVPFHFDLSGTAFGAMAKPGQGANLRQLGQVDIEFQRVPCNYGRTKIAFKMDSKTNPYWFSTAIQFGDKDGGLKSVEIAQAGAHYFTPMNNIWGAVWVANTDPSFQGPFTFRLTSPTNEVVVARHAVPKDFQPGQTYFSNVNF
ncbi:expansin-B15-like [Rutidosis leptorrhynchoides]|uniref:expansin-B15-like n=1 Tax=Rutidosis leptorrhynchoides TaxID=125765 RepID=UPI003A99A7F1